MIAWNKEMLKKQVSLHKPGQEVLANNHLEEVANLDHHHLEVMLEHLDQKLLKEELSDKV